MRWYVLLFLIGNEMGTLGGLDSEYFVPLLLVKEQLLGGDCWYHWLCKGGLDLARRMVIMVKVAKSKMNGRG